MLEFENKLWTQQLDFIAGVDEVGRGCLFGDVIAAAVILPAGLVIDGVNDSKKISEKKREKLYDIILSHAVSYGIGVVDAASVDRINIKQAARLAMRKAVGNLHIVPEHLLVDAEHIDTEIPQTSIIHGDALSQSIAAASIIAKVTRDRMCKLWDEQYPGYGIAVHKGYATQKHRDKIIEMGPTNMHRKTFLTKILVQKN